MFGTSSLEHPGVYDLAANRGRFYYGGSIRGVGVPSRPMVCASPKEVRAEAATTAPAAAAGAPPTPIVAFQCRNPLHKSHWELIRRVLADVPGSRVLIHPTVSGERREG